MTLSARVINICCTRHLHSITEILTPPTMMAPDQQDNPNQDDEEDVPISDLFPIFDQALATFLHDSFNVPKESNSILCEALITSQYRTWSDFLFMEDIDYLTYQDRGTRVPLTRHVQLNLQRLIDFGRHLTDQGLDWEEREHYTKKAFKDYCRGIVKARRDSAADGAVVTNRLKYESWIRKSRDETTFPVLQNDARFEQWLVKFKAKLVTSDIDTHTFLDPNWPDIPLTGYSKALHNKQCAFFWTLLRHVFEGDFSSSCVLYHQWTRNGHQAYFDFVQFHNPVSPPTPPAAPVSSPSPVLVRSPAVNNTVTPRPTPPVSPHAPIPSTSSTPAVHNSPPTTACKTPDHPTDDNPKTDNPETSTSTPSYTWKHAPHFTCTSKTSPANSRWTFYPQSETVVFHRTRTPVSSPQPSCISSLQLPPSGASSKDSVISSSVRQPLYGARKPLYGASFCPVQKPYAYPVRKPLYEAHYMTYDSAAVCITKRHRDAIKIKLYQLHANLLVANWLYDDVT
eukprot:jgi/Psemu1/30620/gm1.30620_g